MKKVFNSASGRFLVLGLFAMMGISSAMIAQAPVSATQVSTDVYVAQEGEVYTDVLLESINSVTAPADATLAIQMIKAYMESTKHSEITPGDDRPYFMQNIGDSLIINVSAIGTVPEATIVTYQDFRSHPENRYLEVAFIEAMFAEYLSIFQ